MYKKLPNVLDTALVTVAGFSASFLVLRFYVKILWLTLLLSALFAIGISVIFRMFRKRKSVKYSLKKEDAEHMERVLNTLCLMTEKELANYFCALFDKMRLPYARDDSIVLTDTNTQIEFYFCFSKTHEGKIIDFYKSVDEGRKLLVIGREFSEETTLLTKRFSGRIKLLDGASMYILMKRFEFFPEIKEELKTEKQSFNLPRALFSRRRARQYFFYGLTLEFFSFFAFYPLYYVLFGGALMIFSIVCLFFGIRDNPDTTNPFRQ